MRCYHYKKANIDHSKLLHAISQVLPITRLQTSDDEIFISFDNYLSALELDQLDAIVRDVEKYLSPFDGQWK